MGAAQQPGSFFQFGWAVFVTPFLLPISFLRDFYQYWATQWRSAPHRVHAPQSGNGRFQAVLSIMMERSALAREGGGVHFHSVYHHIQSCSVRSSWEGRSQSSHRVAIAYFKACIPSWWKNQSSLVGGGGCTKPPPPFHSSYHHIQSCGVRSS